jgi:hypothetical protein
MPPGKGRELNTKHQRLGAIERKVGGERRMCTWMVAGNFSPGSGSPSDLVPLGMG